MEITSGKAAAAASAVPISTQIGSLGGGSYTTEAREEGRAKREKVGEKNERTKEEGVRGIEERRREGDRKYDVGGEIDALRN